MNDKTLALLVGSVAWLLCIGAYASALVAKGRPDATTALVYNAPVAFVFLVLAAHLVVQALRMGAVEFGKVHRWTLLVWLCGGVVLYMRLVTKSLEVSGHLAWLPLLTAQSVVSGFPSWFSIFAALATALAFYMKMALFRGPSGLPGLVVGLLLASAMLAAMWPRRSGARVP